MLNVLALYLPPLTARFATTASDCQKASFLGLKPWYEYLPLNTDCSLAISADSLKDNPGQLWGVGAAVFEDLIRIAALVAVAMVIAGGYRMMISQGEPQAFAAGRKTVINALIGLVIAIIASQIVAFLGGKLVS